jgi:hypothetical protein
VQPIGGHTHVIAKVIGDSRMNTGNRGCKATVPRRAPPVTGLFLQLKKSVLGHHHVPDASATRSDAAKNKCRRMVDVNRTNVAAAEESVQLELIGGPADDPGASQVIQIDAFDAVRFQLIAKRTGGTVVGKTNHAVAARSVFDR